MRSSGARQPRWIIESAGGKRRRRMDIAALDAQWGQCWLKPAHVPVELASEVKKAFGGSLPSWAPLLAPVPWVVRTLIHDIDKKVSYMPIDLWDLVAFVVSQDNSCRYCYGMTRSILRVLGYSDAMIDRLEGDVDLATIPAAEQTALRFARKLSRFHPRPGPKDLAELEAAGFDKPTIGEIVYAAAFAGFGNRVATFLALQPEPAERMMERPLTRLLRPWIARQFRARRTAVAALPAPNEPPFDELIARLDGSPTAHLVRSSVDDMLASQVLPRRTKLLMFAVIARTLDTPYISAQMQRALAGDGLPADRLDAVLSNLGGPELTFAESLLVPFARETVWYRNLDVQQRTREIGERLSAEEVIEAVGVAALANSVARLSVLVDRP